MDEVFVDRKFFRNFAPDNAAIAQLVEHFIRNEKVVGSSPTRGSQGGNQSLPKVIKTLNIRAILN